MDIFTEPKLVLFILFVVPGFISLKAYDILFPGPAKDSAARLIDAVAYSCINYALLAGPLLAMEHYQVRINHPSGYALFMFFALFVTPIAWVFLLSLFRLTEFFQNSMPHPIDKPWDFYFGQRKPCWVIVKLKDGKTIGGKFGMDSFASSAPAPEQIYLEECWHLNEDGGFERPRSDTVGVIVLGSEMTSVEFFKLDERYAYVN